MKARFFGLLAVAVVAAWFAGGRLLDARDVRDDGPKARCDALMAKLKADDLDGFFALFDAEDLNPQNATQKPSDSLRPLLKQQRETNAKTAGKLLGEVELVRTERIGQSYLRLTYLERFERHGWMWQFVFYRTPAGWKNTGLNWDTNATAINALFAVER